MGARCTVESTKPKVLLVDQTDNPQPKDSKDKTPKESRGKESDTEDPNLQKQLDIKEPKESNGTNEDIKGHEDIELEPATRQHEEADIKTCVVDQTTSGGSQLDHSDSGHRSVDTASPTACEANKPSLSGLHTPAAPPAHLGTTSPEPCQPANEDRWVELTGTDSVVEDTVDMGEETGSVESVVAAMSQLKLTKPAPEWRGTAVVDGEFKDISLTDYRGKYLVFFFYPLDFTFVCPTEIIAFSDRVEEFRSIGCEVVACSTDSHFSHLAWVNTPRKQGGLGHMNIPLLADKTCEVAKAYSVLKEDEGIAFRGLFIIDDKGNMRQITINDLPVGRSVDETLRLVQAFQFTDKHGEVCPAGWKPGKATMKPDVKNSKSYFQDNA